jgi:hypothetical protein
VAAPSRDWRPRFEDAALPSHLRKRAFEHAEKGLLRRVDEEMDTRRTSTAGESSFGHLRKIEAEPSAQGKQKGRGRFGRHAREPGSLGCGIIHDAARRKHMATGGS